MNGLGAGATRDLEQPFLVEIALGGRSGADQVGLVGRGGVERATVGLRVDGNRADAELAQGTEDPDRDLAAIGHEHFREGRHGRILPAR